MAERVNTPSGSNVANTDQNNPSQGAEVEKQAAAEPDTTTMADLKGIRYTGRSQVRSISKDDFEKVGVSAKEDLSWSADNGFVVPSEKVNAAVRDYLVADGEFEVVS